MSDLIRVIDPERVGSICIDSTTYEGISDVFDMQNKVRDIQSILNGTRTVVGKLHSNENCNLFVKLNEVENNIIGIAGCYGTKVYNLLNIENVDSIEFAWFYIGLLSELAQNVRAKLWLDHNISSTNRLSTHTTLS